MSEIIKRLLIGIVVIALIPILYNTAPMLLSVLLILAMVILRIKYPVIKGAVGEWYVNQIISKLGPSYAVFHDLYIPNGEGGTTQVDHVVTSPYGIFVIETKHYQGWIFGKENQQYWTQVIYKRKEKLFNPIWQNYGHIQALKKYLGKEELNTFESIVAFSQTSTFKFKEDFKSAIVIQFPQLTQVIKKSTVQRVSDIDLRDINTGLEQLIIKDKREKRLVKKKHVEAIRGNQTKKIDKSNTTSCPKCNGELSLKKGKYGDF